MDRFTAINLLIRSRRLEQHCVKRSYRIQTRVDRKQAIYGSLRRAQNGCYGVGRYSLKRLLVGNAGDAGQSIIQNASWVQDPEPGLQVAIESLHEATFMGYLQAAIRSKRPLYRSVTADIIESAPANKCSLLMADQVKRSRRNLCDRLLQFWKRLQVREVDYDEIRIRRN